ncbi:MAG: helix-turn-helix domain-containing protein [Acidobacteriota bacterium]
MSDLKNYIKKNLIKDPQFAKEWAESEPEYQITRQIIALRIEKGWTQEQLAKALGTKQSTIARIEKGNQNITLQTLTRIAEVLDARVRIDFLPQHQ